MKILTAAEIRAADQASFKGLSLPSLAVMESAGRAVTQFILETFSEQLERGVFIACGSGNNGGDGYVVARALANLGVKVQVLALTAMSELKGDAAAAANSYRLSGGGVDEQSGDSLSAVLLEYHQAARWGLIVDAILGTGIRGEVRGIAASGVSFLNALAARGEQAVLAIDVPSGIDSDSGKIWGTAVRATHTLTLQTLKIGHVLQPAAECCGKVVVADIGLGNHLPELSGIPRALLLAPQVLAWLSKSRMLSNQAHKGTRGHLLVVGGATGKLGAPQLSGAAALLSGSGLVTLAIPHSASLELSTRLKELMCVGLPEIEGLFSEPAAEAVQAVLNGKDAVVIGPGMGEGGGAEALLSAVLNFTKAEAVPVVIDADALNILARKPEFLALLHPACVLTPHPGEMSRLIDVKTAELQERRFEVAQEFSKKHNCVLVLKGARTVVATPSGFLWINPAANAVLGTAGSGDTLAGIIGALLGQGLNAEEAAAVAVYVHGISGERLSETQGGSFGVIADDIARKVPQVMNFILKHRASLSRPRMFVPALPESDWDKLSEENE